MFRKYLCWSAMIHLFVLWGVGACLPPSVPGNPGAIVLEFNPRGMRCAEGVDFAGNQQEENRPVPEGRIPIQPVEKEDPLNRPEGTTVLPDQREAAFFEPQVAAAEQQRITAQENGSNEGDTDLSTRGDLLEVEEANQESNKNDEATVVEEEPPTLIEDSSQLPGKSGQKQISGRELTKETREVASGQNLPDTGEKTSGYYLNQLPEDGMKAATGAGSESGSAEEETGIGRGEPDQMPVLVQSRTPSYPLVARRRGWEGTVTLQIQLDQDGRVGEVEVLESSGYEILDQEAEKTVRGWRYGPAYQNGNPIGCLIKVKITFVLQN